MKKIFLKTMFIALLSAVGVSQAWAVNATPKKQGLGDMDFTHFSYLNSSGKATTATNFGSWGSTPEYIGSFEANRQVVMHLSIPEAGTYAVRYEFSHGNTTEFGLVASEGTVHSFGRTDSILPAPSTGTYRNHFRNFLILNVDGPKDSMAVYMKNITGGNTGTDMRAFRLGYLYKAQAARQTVGDLSIQQFGYCDTVPDFGLWCDYNAAFSEADNQISNFTKGRSDTIKLHLSSKGLYCIAFKYAHNSNLGVNPTYTISGSTDQCTINTSSLTCESTGEDATFSKSSYIYLTATEECDVDVAITNTSSNAYAFANMKEFQLIKADVAEPAYQGIGQLDIKKFAYNASDLNFGYWMDKDYIGNFTDGRADTLKLDIPVAGHYRVTLKIATTQSPEYWITTNSDKISNIKVDNVQHSNPHILYCSSTGGVEKFTTERYFEFDASAAGKVDIAIHNPTQYQQNTSANMKDFVLAKASSKQPEYQGVGSLDFQKFEYTKGTGSAVVPVENFGYWWNKDYIGNFYDNRAINLKLNIEEAGFYRVYLNLAATNSYQYLLTSGSGDSIANICTDAPYSSRYDIMGGSSTGEAESFTTERYFDFEVTKAGEVDVKMANNSSWNNNPANMKNFKLVQCTMVTTPDYQEMGQLDIKQFAYSDSARNFGYWFDKDYIGSFNNSRVDTLKLTIPAAGHYRVSFKTAGTSTPEYWISSNDISNIRVDNKTAGATDAYKLVCTYTGGDEKFTSERYFEFDASAAGNVNIAMQAKSSTYANMKDFVLSTRVDATPEYQATGELDITKFGYNVKEVENFGYWYQGDYVGNFTTGRADTLKLNCAAAGDYRVQFNIASTSAAQYTASSATVSVKADLREDGVISISPTGSLDQFSQTHALYFTVAEPCQVDIAMTQNSNSANMKNFTFTQLGHKIILNANGGTSDSIMYSIGDVFGTLPKAYRYAYTFDGWFSAAEGGEQITATSPCTKDTTIYAHWTAETGYTEITSHNCARWNKDYTFTNGITKSGILGYWVSNDSYNGQCVDGSTRPVDVNKTVIMRFAQAYTDVDQKIYDVYAAVTPITSKITGTWAATTEETYLQIRPNNGGGVDKFVVEIWLQDGDRNATDVEFIAGNCYVSNIEYVSVFGNDGVINSNVDYGKYQYNDGRAGWLGDISLDKEYFYLIGNGYTSDHRVRVAYNSTGGGGKAEIKLGYLNCTYTFNYPISQTETRNYCLNEEVKLSEDATGTEIQSRKGWEITEGVVGLLNGDTLKVGEILTVRTRDSIKVVGNATLQAYAPFNVTFDPNATGATVSPTSKQVEMGGYYGELPTPKGIDNFLGWYTEAEGGTLVTDTTIVMTHLAHTLYAHWEPVYVVSDGTDSTYTAAQNEVNTKLAAWATRGVIDVTVKRTIYKDGCYNTICLPFDLTNEQIVEAFGEYTALKQFVSATVQGEESNRSLVIELEEVTTIAAGKPYLISFASGANLPQVTFKDVTVTATEPETVGEGDVTFNGILTPVILEYENHNLLFVGGNNKLYWPKSDGKFTRGFRAYFEVSTTCPVIARGMKAVFGEKTTPTGNTNIKTTANEIKKLVEAGRVVILCDGVKYDLNGNILK